MTVELLTRHSRRVLPVVLAVTVAVSVAVTVGVQHLLAPSLSITDEFVGKVGIINFDGSKGCVTVNEQDFNRCSAFYTHTELKVGDKVHVWVQKASALPYGAEIYLVVPEAR